MPLRLHFFGCIKLLAGAEFTAAFSLGHSIQKALAELLASFFTAYLKGEKYGLIKVSGNSGNRALDISIHLFFFTNKSK